MSHKTLAGLVAVCLAGNTVAQEQIDEIVVEGIRDESTTIGRNTLGIRELPRSVQIISNEFIQEIRPYALEDVLTLASNTAFLGDNDGRENSFIMRGFQSTPILRDGFRIETFGGVLDPELWGLERIEILKGPDSILYGESNPGGLVNLVPKRPLDYDHGRLDLQASSYGAASPRVDIGGGLGSARYRFVGSYGYDDGWRDYDNENERIFVAPSVTIPLGERTRLTLSAEITEDDAQADFGTAIDLNGELTAPPEQVNNHPQDTIERHQRLYGIDVDHRLSESWSLNGRARVIDTGYEYSSLLLPFDLDQQTLTYFRVPAQQLQNNDELAFQFNLSGDFSIGGMRNRVFTGIDYRNSETENQTRFDPGSPAFLDWADPDYSQSPPAVGDIPIAPGFYSNDDIERYGIYLQNHLSLTEKLIASIGMRYDEVDRQPKAGSISSPQQSDETSFQAGLVYGISAALTVFGGYSESFAPNFDLDKNNQPLDPETGAGFEIGIKGELFDGGLSYSAAVFDITKENVATADPSAGVNDPNPFGSIAAGEQQSRGFEVDFTGRISDAWQVFGAYGYTDSEITESNNGDQGLPVIGTPEHTASLWTSYRFSGGTLNGLSIRFGAQYVGERLAIGDPNFDGDTSDQVYIDGYTLLNAGLSYDVADWNFGVQVNNLTDEEYVDAAWGGLSRSVHAGAPIEAVANATYRFR